MGVAAIELGFDTTLSSVGKLILCFASELGIALMPSSIATAPFPCGAPAYSSARHSHGGRTGCLDGALHIPGEEALSFLDTRRVRTDVLGAQPMT